GNSSFPGPAIRVSARCTRSGAPWKGSPRVEGSRSRNTPTSGWSPGFRRERRGCPSGRCETTWAPIYQRPTRASARSRAPIRANRWPRCRRSIPASRSCTRSGPTRRATRRCGASSACRKKRRSLVSAVVVEPWGAHPSYAQGYYDRDNDFYVAWEGISRDPDKLTRYLEEFVYGVPDRAGYVKKQPHLAARLKAKERLSRGVNYGF